MSKGELFWMVMLALLLFGGGLGYRNRATYGGFIGVGIIIWFLAFLIGWAVFGPPIH